MDGQMTRRVLLYEKPFHESHSLGNGGWVLPDPAPVWPSYVSIQYPVSVLIKTRTTYWTLTINRDCTKHLSSVISFNPRGNSVRCRNCTSRRLAHSLPCLYNWQIVESGLKCESIWFQRSNPYNLCVYYMPAPWKPELCFIHRCPLSFNHQAWCTVGSYCEWMAKEGPRLGLEDLLQL